MYHLLSTLFTIDARLFKHYRLLQWFPSYMNLFYESQALMMDNNEGGNDKLNSDNENSIFPHYVNYYIAIMAVSCYKCEYLLHILQE